MKANEIRSIVVAGAGTMGASMAQIFAKCGYDVTLYDIADAAIQRGQNLVRVNQESQVASGDLTQQQSAEILSHLRYTMDKNCFAQCDLVVESILENLEIKQNFWEEVSKIARADCLLCTNTSGLSITMICERVVGKERFCGMHWFNPSHIVPLVEVINGDETAPETAEAVYEFAKIIGKQPIYVKKDALGFIANRLQAAILREALYIKEQGIGDFADIDGAMKYGLGFRYACLGPLEVVDQGGLDIHHHIATYLWEDLADDKYPSGIFEELYQEGKYGVKSGAGFYDYSDGKADLSIKKRDAMYLAMARAKVTEIEPE